MPEKIKICKNCSITDSNIIFKGNLCKPCYSLYMEEYRLTHKEEIKSQRASYRDINKDQIKKEKAEYYLLNKERELLRMKKWKTNNTDNLRLYNNNYYHNNKEHIRDLNQIRYDNNSIEIKNKRNKAARIKRSTNPSFKLKQNVSNSIKKALKQNGGSKKGHSILQFLSYTIQDLKQYLEDQFEPWMTWENHGAYHRKTWNDNDQTTWKWNIDHIIPQSDLPYTSMEDENFKKCWALSNLRPYSAKQNILDGANKVRHQRVNQ